MPVIPLFNESTPDKSTDSNSASLINMYLLANQDQNKYPASAYPTYGATLFSAGSNGIRATHSQHGITYAVDGSVFFSVDQNGVRTTLGNLNTSSGWCKIKGIAAQLLIADNTNGYYFIIASSTFSAISNYGGTLEYISVTNGGLNYINPTVVFTGGGGTGAAATATVSGGSIIAVTITSNGSGYNTNPTVSFTDASGTGAAALAVIQQVSFPANIQDIECQDEFGLVLIQNSQEWQQSAISDLTTWPILAFASTTGNQNYNVGIKSSHRELWLFGTQATEIWDNAGTANFTWSRNSSVYIEYGLAARDSLCKAGNTLYFLGQEPAGGPVFITMNGYAPVIFSTDSINYQLGTYSTVSDCYSITYQQDGHVMIAWTFPTAGITWEYDVTTEQWHQRQSLTNGTQTQWMATAYTYNYQKRLIGDSSGNIHFLDGTNFTENNAAITRTLITHPFYNAALGWIFVDFLQIDFDTTAGSGLSSWNLFISKDGGHTYGSAIPALPQHTSSGYRVYWTRLGVSKTWIFKLQTSMNALPVILGGWANMRGG